MNNYNQIVARFFKVINSRNYLQCTLVVLLIFFTQNTLAQVSAIENPAAIPYYQLVPNRINAVIENCPCKNVVLRAKKGRIKPLNHRINPDSFYPPFIYEDTLDCQYNYFANCDVFSDEIYIGIKRKGKITWLNGSHSIRVRKILEGIHPTYGWGKYMKLDDLLGRLEYYRRGDDKECFQLRSHLVNYNIEAEFKVLRYCVDIRRNDSLIYIEYDIKGANFSSGLLSQIEKAKINDEYKFYNITIQYGDCEEQIEDLIKVVE